MAKTQEIINQMNMLKAQGLSNTQSIDALQKKGHSYTEILGAMNEIQSGGNNMIPNMPNQTIPPTPDIDPGTMNASNEELIETIIEEKWNELIKDINKIISWKDRTEQKVQQLEQQFSDLKNQFDELHRAVIGKIGEYDKNILNVGAEVKAMEKVFSNVLPIFVNNVKELNDISKKFKVVASQKNIKK
jgi:prefoldin subunit 5